MHRHLPPPRLSAWSTNADDLFSSSEAFEQHEYPTSASSRQLRAALAVYAALWATTAMAAAAVAVAPGLAAQARGTLRGFGLDLHPHAATLHVLLVTRLARNMAIAAAPSEWAAIGAAQNRRWRHVVDAVLTATLLTDAGLVGVALGAYGARLLAWLPHLPLEWAALAVGVLPWLAARRGQRRRVDLLAPLAACFVLLLAAACIETWLTPHT